MKLHWLVLMQFNAIVSGESSEISWTFITLRVNVHFFIEPTIAQKNDWVKPLRIHDDDKLKIAPKRWSVSKCSVIWHKRMTEGASHCLDCIVAAFYPSDHWMFPLLFPDWRRRLSEIFKRKRLSRVSKTIIRRTISISMAHKNEPTSPARGNGVSGRACFPGFSLSNFAEDVMPAERQRHQSSPAPAGENGNL
jgi:hypothetical protein